MKITNTPDHRPRFRLRIDACHVFGKIIDVSLPCRYRSSDEFVGVIACLRPARERRASAARRSGLRPWAAATASWPNGPAPKVDKKLGRHDRLGSWGASLSASARRPGEPIAQGEVANGGAIVVDGAI